MVKQTPLPFMETAMINKVRQTHGKFAPKPEIFRKICSVNLTDKVWEWLVAVAFEVCRWRYRVSPPSI